jgi:hypothetical protein
MVNVKSYQAQNANFILNILVTSHKLSTICAFFINGKYEKLRGFGAVTTGTYTARTEQQVGFDSENKRGRLVTPACDGFATDKKGPTLPHHAIRSHTVCGGGT